MAHNHYGLKKKSRTRGPGPCSSPFWDHHPRTRSPAGRGSWDGEGLALGLGLHSEMGWTWRGHPIRPGDLGTGNLRLPAEPHRGGTGLEALLPAEPPGPSPSHPRGRGPPPEKQQGLRWGEDRRCGMWRPWARTGLEGPENRARRKPRAGGPPPHPTRSGPRLGLAALSTSAYSFVHHW